MRKAISAAALILALTCPARAGWMPNGIEEPLSPQTTNTIQESAPTDDDDTTGVTDTLTEIVLTALVSVLP